MRFTHSISDGDDNDNDDDDDEGNIGRPNGLGDSLLYGLFMFHVTGRFVVDPNVSVCHDIDAQIRNQTTIFVFESREKKKRRHFVVALRPLPHSCRGSFINFGTKKRGV